MQVYLGTNTGHRDGHVGAKTIDMHMAGLGLTVHNGRRHESFILYAPDLLERHFT